MGCVVAGRFDLTETREELVVIVGGEEFGFRRFPSHCQAPAPGIAGDPAGVGRSGVDGARGVGVVVERADDDGTGPGNSDLDSAAKEDALLVAAFEVVHLAGSTCLDPGLEALSIGVIRDRSDSCGVEAGLSGLFLQPLLEVGSPLGG